MEVLPKRYRKVCYDASQAVNLLKQRRIAIIPHSMWQKVSQMFGKPTCLRATYFDVNYGNIVVIHRYPPKP